MKNAILNNLGLKLLALLLAIVTWIYIVIELQEGAAAEREALQSILPPYRMVSKKIPIKLSLMGEPKDGYVVAYDQVAIKPSDFFIVGPKSILNKLSSVETETIDISGYSKTLIKDVTIIPPTKGMIKEKFVTVTVPILMEKD
ncbi:YbbR-like domain-containing protein [Omnitrophica bacterium]|nr:YbbR-like domain-containing protein [Candidatus Omnitrophota bacterium]